jgi:hypothetical protein
MPKQDNIITEQIILEEQVNQDLTEQEQSTQTQLRADDILKTKQLIPHNFVELETKGKNYMCSTEGWKEPICERYGFSYQNKWIQIDVPHKLMNKLELKKGQNIIYPVYINSDLLNKDPDECGGITVNSEEDIILVNSQAEKVWLKEKETQTSLTGEQIKQMEQELASKRTELINFQVGKSWEDLEKDNEYQKKVKELDDLQTKYELETKTKEELLNYLTVYRRQRVLEYNEVYYNGSGYREKQGASIYKLLNSMKIIVIVFKIN